MKIIGKEQLLSNNRKKIIKRYYNQLKNSNVELEYVEVTNDGILYNFKFDDKIVTIEDDIVNDIFIYSNKRTLLLEMYINIKHMSNNSYKLITKEELLNGCSKEYEYSFDIIYNSYLPLFVNIKNINGKSYYKDLTYEEYINDINKNHGYEAKRIKTYSQIENPTIINDSKGFYVYKFLNKYNEILYIGKTIDIKDRMYTHFGSNGHLGKDKYSQVYKIEYIECDNNADMSVKEIYFINKYKPPFNTSTLWDGEISNEIYDNIIWNKEFDMKLINKEVC